MVEGPPEVRTTDRPGPRGPRFHGGTLPFLRPTVGGAQPSVGEGKESAAGGAQVLLGGLRPRPHGRPRMLLVVISRRDGFLDSLAVSPKKPGGGPHGGRY